MKISGSIFLYSSMAVGICINQIIWIADRVAEFSERFSLVKAPEQWMDGLRSKTTF